MSTSDFLIIFACVAITMLLCRVLPIFLLKGRHLPPTLVQALNFIPPAAFAALVMNDLFNPATIASGNWRAWLIPLVASGITIAVGLKTKSLAWCIITGVGSFAALQIILP